MASSKVKQPLKSSGQKEPGDTKETLLNLIFATVAVLGVVKALTPKTASTLAESTPTPAAKTWKQKAGDILSMLAYLAAFVAWVAFMRWNSCD